jgi:tetratricopeptide (TPR) repeat protein
MAYRLIAFGVLVIMLCSCNNNTKSKQVNQPKSGGELIEEAYKQEDWDLIISVGDTLLSDDDPHNISIAYAEALAFKGNIEKAINVLNRKIAQKPEDYYLYQTKGNIFAIIENFDSALANYDIVIEMKPTYARPYINEGEIYEILGEKKKAIEKYMVATFLFAKNRYETEAYEMEKRILKLDPDYKDVKELMHDMGLE